MPPPPPPLQAPTAAGEGVRGGRHPPFSRRVGLGSRARAKHTSMPGRRTFGVAADQRASPGNPVPSVARPVRRWEGGRARAPAQRFTSPKSPCPLGVSLGYKSAHNCGGWSAMGHPQCPALGPAETGIARGPWIWGGASLSLTCVTSSACSAAAADGALALDGGHTGCDTAADVCDGGGPVAALLYTASAWEQPPPPPGRRGRYPPPPPLQGAQPMPSHCPPDAKCQPQWHS